MSPALIIIDLQNDFLSPDGQLKNKHIPLPSLLPQLTSVCTIFKEQKWPIFAVRSEYEITDSNSSDNPKTPHLEGTHTGRRPFCSPSSWGAEFHPDALALFDDVGAQVVTKSMYSAFTRTALHALLQFHGIGTGPLYFAGLTANNCVLATLTSAFKLGYSVIAISDCIGATSSTQKTAALKTIDTYYGSSIASADIHHQQIRAEFEACKKRRILYWVSGSIPSWRVMLALSLKKIPYTAKRLHVMTTPKETRAPEFLAINARGKTPTFIDSDGTVVIESLAILQYLETCYPSIPLSPDPEIDKAAFSLTLQRFHESENLHNSFEDIELVFLKDWRSNASYKQRIYNAYTNTMNELRFWEGYLANSRFVTGEDVSLADCAFYPNVAYLIHRGLDLEREAFPNLKSYCALVGEMDCAKDARPVGWDNKGGKNLFMGVREAVAEIEGKRELLR